MLPFDVRLNPADLDKLVLHQAGFLAQKRVARGVRLNDPEAVALISTQVMEFIRDGHRRAARSTAATGGPTGPSTGSTRCGRGCRRRECCREHLPRQALPFVRTAATGEPAQVDVAGGDKVPRKGGPGITQSDVLVINKTDLAPLVGANLEVMAVDARRMRGECPVVFTQVTHGEGVDQVIRLLLEAWRAALPVPLPP